MSLDKIVRILDFAVAAASLVYGFATQSPIWVLGGFGGLCLAAFNPAIQLTRLILGIKRPHRSAGVKSIIDRWRQ
jgi:hypothetical protein